MNSTMSSQRPPPVLILFILFSLLLILRYLTHSFLLYPLFQNIGNSSKSVSNKFDDVKNKKTQGLNDKQENNDTNSLIGMVQFRIFGRLEVYTFNESSYFTHFVAEEEQDKNVNINDNGEYEVKDTTKHEENKDNEKETKDSNSDSDSNISDADDSEEEEEDTSENNNNNKDDEFGKDIQMDEIEKAVFGNDLDAYREFYNISDVEVKYFSESNPDRYDLSRDFSTCKVGKFVFPHVPKTAGRSVVFTLYTKHTHDNLGFIRARLDKLKEFPRSYISTNNFISRGHLPISTLSNSYIKYAKTHKVYEHSTGNGLSKKQEFFMKHCLSDSIANGDVIPCSRASLNDDCVAWMFFIREPLSRLISAFYTSRGRNVHFVCGEPGTKEYKVMMDPQAEIMDWLSLPFRHRRKNCDVFNQHAMFLAHEYAYEGDKLLLLAAKKRLLEMDWFGITPRFEDSIAMLSHNLNLQLLQYRPIFNYNPHVNNLTKEIEMRLQKGQEVDILLYRLAERIFDKRLKALVDKIGERKESQIFKCDKRVYCVLRSPMVEWYSDEPIPDEVDKLPPRDRESILCLPSTACNRKEIW